MGRIPKENEWKQALRQAIQADALSPEAWEQLLGGILDVCEGEERIELEDDIERFLPRDCRGWRRSERREAA